jgi:inner membrane protein
MVMASHGLLDTLTDGGLGIALLWPFSNARYFATWRPIPVAPIGPRLFGARGILLMLHESILFLPLFVMGLWPRSNGRGTLSNREGRSAG